MNVPDSPYEKWLFPLIRRFDPETVHDQTLAALSLAQSNPAGRAILRAIAGEIPALPVEIGKTSFPNPLGVAAGFDKDARVVPGLALLGFGHIEVGTLTPRPQPGNQRPRVFRLQADGALINRMGFPNAGVKDVVARLRSLASKPRRYVLGVSIGKQKETPLDEAVADYLAVMRATYPYADYLAVNISSPNTPGLRDLQGGRYLEHLLRELVTESYKLAAEFDQERRPLWVKIAPDLTWAELDDVIATIATAGIDGIIATNTTLSREGVTGPSGSEAGGLSGRPLRSRSTEIIGYIRRHAPGELPIIGVGGVQTADDVREKLDAGASLVQIYTGMVYGGPGLAGRILRDLGQSLSK